MLKNYNKFLFWSQIILFTTKTINGFSQTTHTSIINKPDYSQLSFWAAHPDKSDPSDSTPSPLRLYEAENTGVDVFFIHPTTYTRNKKNSWNASIIDSEINSETDKSTILYQASVFNEGNKVFAPRYRQAHISAFYSNDDSAEISLEIAYQDVKIAFQYYLDYYNHDKPIIIASHSQGTRHAGRLLKEFFENKPLQKKLVCAYIIGMPVPENYFNSIPPCNDSTQTGCFVAWRTYVKNYTPQFVEKEKFKSIVVNPISWKINNEYVSAKKNSGGIMMKFNKLIPKIVDAQIHGNILWACKPHIFGRLLIRQKNFHIGDINLYYNNIRQNVRCRIRNYFLLQ